MSISENQLLNLVLQERDYSIIENNGINEEYFAANKEEFNFLKDFAEASKTQDNRVPDKEFFTSKFPNFEYFTVHQNVKSIVDNLREEMLFRRAVSLINESSKLFESDSRKGAEYLLSKVDTLRLPDDFESVDIIKDDKRFKEWAERRKDNDKAFIELPFKEMKDDLFGFVKGEELFLWLARSGELTPSYKDCVEFVGN